MISTSDLTRPIYVQIAYAYQAPFILVNNRFYWPKVNLNYYIHPFNHQNKYINLFGIWANGILLYLFFFQNFLLSLPFFPPNQMLPGYSFEPTILILWNIVNISRLSMMTGSRLLLFNRLMAQIQCGDES